MTSEQLKDFAERYAEAWCSHNPEKVAAFYAKTGWISVNGGPPVPITEVARGFMRDFPDMVVKFDRLGNVPAGTEFHWTFTGTNTGPGGTGNRVCQRLRALEDQRRLDCGIEWPVRCRRVRKTIEARI